MSVRATTFWEYLGVLRYIQIKYRVWLNPSATMGSGNWPDVEAELWRDFHEDYVFVRTQQRLLGTTFIKHLHTPYEDTPE